MAFILIVIVFFPSACCNAEGVYFIMWLYLWWSNSSCGHCGSLFWRFLFVLSPVEVETSSNTNFRFYLIHGPILPSEWRHAKFTSPYWVKAKDNLKWQKQSNHVHVSKGTLEVNCSLMKPKCTNPIDLAIGCSFILARANRRIISLVRAFISYVLEVRYLDFTTFWSAHIIHENEWIRVLKEPLTCGLKQKHLRVENIYSWRGCFTDGSCVL